MKVLFKPLSTEKPLTVELESEVVLLVVAEVLEWSEPMLGLDEMAAALLAAATEQAGFAGRLGTAVDLYLNMAGRVRRLILFGGGRPQDLLAAEQAGAKLFDYLEAAFIAEAEILIGEMAFEPPLFLAHLAYGARLRAYGFSRYKTLDVKVATPLAVIFRHPQAVRAELVYAGLSEVAAGVALARDYGNMPPNLLTPQIYAAECLALADLGLQVEVLNEAALKELGMGALLGVAQGSAEPPAVVLLSWRADGVPAQQPPVVLVGKGVTFDSGGLLPKGPEEMWDMKFDMCGSAAVVGAMRALAGGKARAHVVGIIGLVENMPSGSALRPGDVVTSYSGETIEVLHTDAEGRLVLADLLGYACRRFKPVAMVDIATLTGGMASVLGDEYGGLHANDDALAAVLTKAGETSGERIWRLPLCDGFDRMINSSIADVQNISKQRLGGSATAAQFLQRFVGDCPWAHLDILAMAYGKNRKGDIAATGFGVRLLHEFIIKFEAGL